MGSLTLNKSDLIFLERVRACAKEVRAYPSLDMFKACQLISMDIELLSSEVLEILVRSLPLAFGRHLAIQPPGAVVISWDERWLLSLVSSVSNADFDSVQFLVKSAVKKNYRTEFLTIASELWKISA